MGAAECGTRGGGFTTSITEGGGQYTHQWRCDNKKSLRLKCHDKAAAVTGMLRYRDSPVIAKVSCAGITHITGNNVMSRQQNTPRLAKALNPNSFLQAPPQHTQPTLIDDSKLKEKFSQELFSHQFTTHPSVNVGTGDISESMQPFGSFMCFMKAVWRHAVLLFVF